MLLNLIIELIRGTTPLDVLLLQILFSVLALLLVFPVHEFAHGLAAYACGDKTAKYQGRLTLNPLAHIDVLGFVFILLFGFGWAKPVQIDSRYFKNRRLGTVCTAAAGPVSNVLFCFVSYLIYGVLSVYAAQNSLEWLSIFSQLFFFMTIYNATFAVFNLIPVPPLDGSKIVAELLPVKWRFRYYNLERYSHIIFIALILILNRTSFLETFSMGIIALFTPVVNLILGGIFG